MLINVRKSLRDCPTLWAGAVCVGVSSLMVSLGVFHDSLIVAQAVILTGSGILIFGGRFRENAFFVMFFTLLSYYVLDFVVNGEIRVLHLTTPRIHLLLIGVATILFLAGGWWRGRNEGTMAVCAVTFSIAGGSCLLFQPRSSVLERTDVVVEASGIVVSRTPFFLLRGMDNEFTVALPGSAGTPWFTRHGNLCRGEPLQKGLTLEGVMPSKSEFLPIHNSTKRIAVWTYLGGGKSPASPLDPVRTSILNHGFY